ncbi:MAG: gliding motility-associated C-terminal domain-containing protein [Cyclobacteriaceae bacterium]|jgi:trimeric autotransporter adhesin|nr:gliding motility-associated C-terminal domain-containing protein [Cyclobacteriaceae bacterium]
MKKLVTLSIFLLYLTLAHAQTALQDSWITNGRVNNIVTGDGKVMLMGEFDWFGPAYHGGTAAFSNTLVEDESYPKIEEEVLTAISDDAGGWYVGIQDRVGTYESKIIHIHADKTIDELPITLGESTWVKALAKSGNTLYFAGYFQSVNGTTRNSAAAINLTNNTLTSWNPNVDVSGGINVLTFSGSTIYAGGSFSNIGGQPRTYVAALDATTGLATSWNVTVTGNTLAEVNAILVNAGVVYIGGYFQNVNAAVPSRTNFAAVNAATAALETFNPRPDGTVKTLLLDGPMLYMAGGFDHVLSVTRFRVARIELATSTLTPFELVFFSNTHSNFYGYDQVNTVGIDGNKLFIGGTFPRVNGEQQPHLAAVDKVTGVLEPSDDKKIYGEVNTLLVNGGYIFVGGYIIGHLGTTIKNGIAALDETTGAGIPGWTDQIPPPPEDEYYEDLDFHYQDGRMYYYLNISDGTTLLGALNSDNGSVINTWSVTVNHHLNAWAFSDNTLYLADQGIDAMTINGQSRERFAAVDLETGALLPFTINFPLALDEHYITSLAVSNNALYVAGAFSFTNNSVERNSFAAWNATTGALLPWSPRIAELDNSEGPVIAALTSSWVYLIGNYRVRRVHPTTGVSDDDWEPTQNDVISIAVHNNSVFVGGSFSPGLVHLDGTTGQPAAWQPDFEDVEDSEGSIRAIATAGGKLLVGGNFYYIINGIQRYHYAEYLLPTSTNSAPTIEAIVQSVPIQGRISIYLADIVTDAEDNIDFSTATILSPPTSGATAYIEDGYLIIDYGQTPFSGTERLTLRVCDTEDACTEQEITIDTAGDVTVYNALSPNNDGLNDIFYIEYINLLPETQSNNVSIYNRWGAKVFEVSDYNNDSNVFKGVNQNGGELPSGTYYYKIEFNNGQPTKTGYLALKR